MKEPDAPQGLVQVQVFRRLQSTFFTEAVRPVNKPSIHCQLKHDNQPKQNNDF